MYRNLFFLRTLILLFITVFSLSIGFPLFGANSKKEIDKGNKAISEGRFDDAVNLFETILKRKPKNGEARFNKGLAEYKKGDYGTAEQSFLDAADCLKNKKKASDAYYNAGNAAYKNGDIKRAISHLYRSLELNPKNKKAAHNLQKMREEKKQNDGKSNQQGDSKQQQNNPSDQKSDNNKNNNQNNDNQNKDPNTNENSNKNPGDQKDNTNKTQQPENSQKEDNSPMKDPAQAILDKEREQNAKRNKAGSAGQKTVEKDW